MAIQGNISSYSSAANSPNALITWIMVTTVIQAFRNQFFDIQDMLLVQVHVRSSDVPQQRRHSCFTVSSRDRAHG